jgi:hypothetical protein
LGANTLFRRDDRQSGIIGLLSPGPDFCSGARATRLPPYVNCGGIFQNLFIALLKPPFKFSADYHVSAGAKTAAADKPE